MSKSIKPRSVSRNSYFGGNDFPASFSKEDFEDFGKSVSLIKNKNKNSPKEEKEKENSSFVSVEKQKQEEEKNRENFSSIKENFLWDPEVHMPRY